MINTPDFFNLESKIVDTRGKDKSLIEIARAQTLEYKDTLDRIMTRFIDDFGPKLDVEATRNEKYLKFVKIKSEQYEKATRMLRLIKFYETA